MLDVKDNVLVLLVKKLRSNNLINFDHFAGLKNNFDFNSSKIYNKARIPDQENELIRVISKKEKKTRLIQY